MKNLFTYSYELFVSHIGIQKVRNGVNCVPLLVQKDGKEYLYVFASKFCQRADPENREQLSPLVWRTGMAGGWVDRSFCILNYVYALTIRNTFKNPQLKATIC